MDNETLQQLLRMAVQANLSLEDKIKMLKTEVRTLNVESKDAQELVHSLQARIDHMNSKPKAP